MTHDDDRLRRLFASISFPDEPLAPSSIDADVRRARRYFRRRRAATWGTVTASVAVLASGVAFALPSLDSLGGADHAAAGQPSVDEAGDQNGADGGDTATQLDVPEAPCPESAGGADPQLPFSNTRQCLLEIAVKHLDPEWTHLPEASTNAGSGGGEKAWRVSTKLGWSVPGESGLGMVQVAVTTPGFADDQYVVMDMPGMMGCGEQGACSSQPVPGTGETVLVAGADPDSDFLLGVLYERSDGSMVSVAVHTLFGNNSLEPVSDVDITLEQAMAFVTDPALRVDRAEIANAQETLAAEMRAEASPEDADFSSSELVPAPHAEAVNDADTQTALDACTDSVPEWQDFDPVFGMSIETESGGTVQWVIAERGATKLYCADGDAMLFGTSDVKGTPYLRGEVSQESGNFGRHTPDVARVTVQSSGGPQRDAVMRDGYWYLPAGDVDPSQVAYRGYDAAGELIYDSTTVDPDACYSDPDGTEIVQYGTDEAPDVEDCIPMLEWGF